MGNGEEIREITFAAYHGTSNDFVSNILSNGFIIGENDNDWLGNGVYFFVDNNEDIAKKNAMNYAKKIKHYKQYAVLLANISVAENNVIDYDKEENQLLFHEVRDGLIKIFIDKGITVHFESSKKFDCFVFNEIHKDSSAKVALKKVFINFDKYIDGYTIHGSSIPNCRIMCVIDNSVLKRNNVTLIERGNSYEKKYNTRKHSGKI